MTAMMIQVPPHCKHLAAALVEAVELVARLAKPGRRAPDMLQVESAIAVAIAKVECGAMAERGKVTIVAGGEARGRLGDERRPHLVLEHAQLLRPDLEHPLTDAIGADPRRGVHRRRRECER